MNYPSKSHSTIPQLTMNPWGAIIMLLGFAAIMMTCLSGVTIILNKIFTNNPLGALRISMVFQDIFVFIIPALATAILATRLPAQLLALNTFPSGRIIVLSILALLFAIPAVNALVEWNQSIKLPSELHLLEETMRQMEQHAQSITDLLLGGNSIGALVLGLLIVGILAGLSEEIFFRGAMQRLMAGTSIGRHRAVWITALIFSVMHFQFFGLFPRFLLGLYFGYLLLWSGSIWLPIIIHVLNNSLVIIATWHSNLNTSAADINQIGTDLQSPSQLCMLIASVILTSLTIYLIYRDHQNAYDEK